MLRLRELLPPNRVAALVGFLTASTAALTSFAGTWGDERVVKAVGGAAGVLGAVAVVLKFLAGSQQWEAFIADPTKDVAVDGTAGNSFDPGDDPFAAPDEDEE